MSKLAVLPEKKTSLCSETELIIVFIALSLFYIDV